MAKVPLRKYNSEIESLIDRGQADEAIAHARHILQTYPKCLETYRLLGKAYLETKRHGDASDIFNRILMAVPDDFVSHVGLSIIADEGKRMDDAIWHMERAFEKQPSNAAIHSELQRLYGRRDGREPPKIRLTRGALAHMYVQGELFPAAIAEARAVLAEEPSRAELQALLALAYFRGGQKVEASETCTRLLNQFPYCLDANRVLVEILPGTGMADSAAAYKQRVVELDPYAAYARGSIFQTAEVPDASVAVERLDYRGPAQDAGGEWDKSLAIGLGGGAVASNAQPDWMRGESSAFDSPSPLSTPEADASFASDRDAFAAPANAPDENVDGIPDWMQKAGWGQSTGAFDESQATMDSEPAADELAKADLPDWIKSMAPAETPTPAAPASAPSDDDMDWLNKLGGDRPFDTAPFLGAQELPLEAAPTATPAEYPQGEPAAPAAGFPDWISELGAPMNAPQTSAPAEYSQGEPAAPAEGFPDWLSELGAPMQGATSPASTPTEYPQGEPAAPAGMGNLGTSAAEQDAAMAWLESLAAKQGAKSEELITDPNARSEVVPDWIEQAKAVGDSIQPVTKDETPDDNWLADLGAPVAATAASATAEWLSTLDDETPEDKPIPVEHSAAEAASATADWLSKLDDIAPEPTNPEPAAPTGLGSLGTSEAEQDAAMAWLESLATKQGAKSEELITDPNARSETVPDWIEQAKAVGDSIQAVARDETMPAPEPMLEAAPEPTPEPTPSPLDQTGTWLRDLDEQDIRPVASKDSDWLRKLEESETAQEMPEAQEKPVETEAAQWSGELEFTPPPSTGQLGQSASEADLPSWLRGLETANVEEEMEAVAPSVESLPDWLRGEEPEAPKPPSPTRPAEWVPEATKPASAPKPVVAKPAPKPKAEPKKVEPKKAEPKPELRRTGMLPPLIDPALAAARDALSHGKIPDALQAYANLIRKGKLLEDITFDLKEALYRFPVEVSIWQALGDAYMRANRLQDALDAYTKAEELLR
ncbi:MAG: tetratricopeptide repeat protein [Chloroflexi bacterium]|nr:tetratricopeptide repeat protein [Chloroflexota bacterium]